VTLQKLPPPSDPSGELPTQIHDAPPSARHPHSARHAQALYEAQSEPPPSAGPRRAQTVRTSSVRPSGRSSKRPRDRDAEAAREKLLLVAAIMMLLLALGWMWTQLRNDDVPRPVRFPQADAAAFTPLGAVPAASASALRRKPPPH